MLCKRVLKDSGSSCSDVNICSEKSTMKCIVKYYDEYYSKNVRRVCVWGRGVKENSICAFVSLPGICMSACLLVLCVTCT